MATNYVTDTFGERLRIAFDYATNAEIARRLTKTDAAVKNYVEGRIPPAETLIEIARLTGCSLHWLLTGEGERLARLDAATAGTQLLASLRRFIETTISEQPERKTTPELLTGRAARRR